MYADLTFRSLATLLVSLALAISGLAQDDRWETVIIDQPEFRFFLQDARGMPDGGVAVAGYTYIPGDAPNTAEHTAIIARYDAGGVLLYEKRFSLPGRTDAAFELDVDGDDVYALLESSVPDSLQRGVELWRFSGVDGRGEVMMTFPEEIGGDESGRTHGLVVTDEAVFVSRDAVTSGASTYTQVVQAYGLAGDYRGKATDTYSTRHARAWPAAGGALFNGNTLTLVRADGSSEELPYRTGGSFTFAGASNFIASGARLIYPQRGAAEAAWVTVTVDGGRLSYETRPIGAPLANLDLAEFGHWGPDSFALTAHDRSGGQRTQHIVAMDGTYGRRLPPVAEPLTLLGPYHSTLTYVLEDAAAPPRRRFWEFGGYAYVTGLRDVLTAETSFTPTLFGAPDPGLNNLSHPGVDGRAGYYAFGYGEGGRRFVRFDARGRELDVPDEAHDFGAERAQDDRLHRLSSGAYAVTSHFRSDSIVFLDDRFVPTNAVVVPEAAGFNTLFAVGPRGSLYITTLLITTAKKSR